MAEIPGDEVIVQTLAWMAGLFEGEGSVGISKPNAHSLGALHVDIPNTDRQILDPFRRMWDGSLVHALQRPPRRDYWRWKLASTAAAEFLEAILPFLHTDKYRERAVLGIYFQRQKFNHFGQTASAEYVAAQWDFYREMRVLNRRGVQEVA